MYENQTSQVINRRMLDAVSTAMDKREGSVIFDATKPVSIELELMYAAVDWLMRNTFGDTADREFLIERALERGLRPFTATKAKVAVEVQPSGYALQVGARFSCAGLNYKITQQLEPGRYAAECEAAGTEGNKTGGALVPVSYLAGLRSARIAELLIPAIDDEKTEAFRQRYLNSFAIQAYGGNIADYKEKVLSIAGVGGVKVYPVWNGGGTVKVVFCNSEFKTPASEFVAQVQEALDPVPYHQQGVGVAPIGHYVTVEGTTDATINLSALVSVKPGFVLNDVKPATIAAVQEYLNEINTQWKDTQIVSVNEFTNEGLIVRISKLESRILDVTGVLDVENLTVNGTKRNVTLGLNELAILGGLTYE